MTHDDILHEEIIKRGQNKYSTLKKVSSRSTEFLVQFIFAIIRLKRDQPKQEFLSSSNCDVLHCT